MHFLPRWQLNSMQLVICQPLNDLDVPSDAHHINQVLTLTLVINITILARLIFSK